MGDERGSANESENLEATDGELVPAAVVPSPVVQPPRPVSLPPRPSGTPIMPPLRPLGTPPPPPVRSLPPLSGPSQQPPPPPLRANSSPPPLPPSMRPPAPSMRPPGSTLPRPQTATSSTGFRPDGGRVQELLAELMRARKELSDTATELRKVISERNALRIRLVQAENSARELASAFRAEAQLRTEFVDAHAASSAALRARISELEAALAAASRIPKPEEQPSLRQIRGIGPAFERGLLSLGISRVSQIAALGAHEIERIAPLIKARADRILRDDWVGQAKRLLGE
jgi:predicted flap endonuclease-1-like 5' DNA nuclease